ncbi:hypothetical protein [Streptomyces sp. NPDC005533]|uniref:hypothetical protein n=1 Tax=Streptomyces sp. NPDC005533 TaxID=3364723 RepID=UPI0036B8F24D
MMMRRTTWNRFLRHPGRQFAIVAVLVLALFVLVGLGVQLVLDVLFGGRWMVY